MSKQEARLILLFFAFILDSVLSYFLPYSLTKSNLMIVPSLGLIIFIFLNHFMNRQDRIVYSIGVGLYYAIIYGESLLIYVLIFVTIALIGAKYERISSFTFFETLVFSLSMISLKEIVMYILVKFTGVTSLAINKYIMYRLLPSLGCNAIIFIPTYFFFLKYQEIAKEKGYDC